jgi:signal transduction histidine kinase/ActR/RegA family two-component response regulator
MKNNSVKTTTNAAESSDLHNKKLFFLKEETTKVNGINHLYKPMTFNHKNESNHSFDDMDKYSIILPGTTKYTSDKYKELYDFAPSAYITLSRNTDIIEMNLAGANMIGIAHTDYRSQPFSYFVNDETQPLFNQFIRTIFRSNDKVSCEVTLFSDFNMPKYVKLTGIANEDNTQCLVNVIDISSQKEAEKNLIMAKKELAFQIFEKELLAEKLIIAKEKAENKVKIKSNFLANIGHEIKTPLNGILGYSDLLKQVDLSHEMQQFCLSMIDKGGIHLLNIVNNLLSDSKKEILQNEVTITPCNINEQIEYIYNFFKLEVEQKGLQISFQNSLPNCEAVIDSDSDKINSILTNLVKNAISYSDEGSIEIGYTLKPVNRQDTLFSGLFSEHREKPHNFVNIEFFVKDTGIGVPINKQEAIFGRYVQVDCNDKRAAHGVGLGLAISKNYVEMLDGEIWVESDPGNGSIFYFTIPFISKQSEKLVRANCKSKEIPLNDIKDLKILIVDDDISLGMLQAELVINNSIFVQNVFNGIEALEACKMHNDFDLILMDINMPKMNGFDAIEQIRQLNKDVIIIAQTVYPQEEEIALAYDAGCNDYIQKTLNKSTMLELLRKYFSKTQNQFGEINIEVA